MVEMNLNELSFIKEFLPEFCFINEAEMNGRDICAYTGEICTYCLLKEY